MVGDLGVFNQGRSHEILSSQVEKITCVGVALALRARSVCELGGSGGTLPQENFGFLDLLRVFLVHFRGAFWTLRWRFLF